MVSAGEKVRKAIEQGARFWRGWGSKSSRIWMRRSLREDLNWKRGKRTNDVESDASSQGAAADPEATRPILPMSK